MAPRDVGGLTESSYPTAGSRGERKFVSAHAPERLSCTHECHNRLPQPQLRVAASHSGEPAIKALTACNHIFALCLNAAPSFSIRHCRPGQVESDPEPNESLVSSSFFVLML